jgi:preprotein translocase subunit SecE
MVLVLSSALGCVELYAWIQSPTQNPTQRPWGDRALLPGRWFEELPVFGVPLSVKFLFCLALFLGLMYGVRWWMKRGSTVETLNETELEMKKVSWPTRQESMNATWVVVLVTIVLTGTLAAFDGALRVILRLIF